MSLNRAKESFSDIVEFFSIQSPYRSATKGWLTDDLYLQWGPTEEKRTAKLEEMAKVSFYWKPIIQLLSILFIIISFSVFLAFSPLYIVNHKPNSNIYIVEKNDTSAVIYDYIFTITIITSS